jgi:hypothetical protein
MLLGNHIGCDGARRRAANTWRRNSEFCIVPDASYFQSRGSESRERRRRWVRLRRAAAPACEARPPADGDSGHSRGTGSTRLRASLAPAFQAIRSGCHEPGVTAPISRVYGAMISAKTTLCPLRNSGPVSRPNQCRKTGRRSRPKPPPLALRRPRPAAPYGRPIRRAKPRPVGVSGQTFTSAPCRSLRGRPGLPPCRGLPSCWRPSRCHCPGRRGHCTGRTTGREGDAPTPRGQGPTAGRPVSDRATTSEGFVS